MTRNIAALIVATAILTVVNLASAQRPEKVGVVGFLSGANLSSIQPRTEAFRAGLRDLGYVEGQNIAIEWRSADGNTDRLPSLAAELARLRVEIIVVAGGDQVARAAKQTTQTIPIVMANAFDPVATGLVASLARPGGNITGLATIPGPEIYGKQVELLKEAIPKLNRIGVLSNPTNPFSALALKETETTSRRFGMSLQLAEARSADEIETALAALTKGHVGALLELQDPMFFGQRTRLADLEAKNGCRRCTQAQNMWRLVA